MALKARIKTVEYEVTDTYTDPDTGEEVSVTTDLSLTGELRVTAEYIDSGNPSVVLETQTFQVSATDTEQAIADRVIAWGAKVRDARMRAAGLSVYIGVMLDIP